jgi:hypothetical protein
MEWFEGKKDKDYVKRQVYMLSNLGLFYVILLALFAVPLVGTFVVVLIKGIIDLRMLILPVALIAFGLMIYLIIRRLRRLLQRNYKDGEQLRDGFWQRKPHDQIIQISVFKGLFALTFGNPKALPTTKQLALPSQDCSNSEEDVLSQLKELVALKKAGDIDEDEFRILKTQLIENSRSLVTDQQKID